MYGGGDGGAADARQQEDQRQARVQSAVDAINQIFNGTAKQGINPAKSLDTAGTYYDERGNQISNGQAYGVPQGLSQYIDLNTRLHDGKLFTGAQDVPGATSRDQLYADQKKAVTDLNMQEVDRQYKEAERQNRFGLARSGLIGGSAQVDTGAELQDRTNRGRMQAASLGDAAAAELKTQDERARQSLISQAQSGIDVGTAQTMAQRQLDASAQAAAGNRQGAAIGNLFGDMSQAYLLNQQRAGYADGLARNPYTSYGSLNVRRGDSGSVQN